MIANFHRIFQSWERSKKMRQFSRFYPIFRYFQYIFVATLLLDHTEHVHKHLIISATSLSIPEDASERCRV